MLACQICKNDVAPEQFITHLRGHKMRTYSCPLCKFAKPILIGSLQNHLRIKHEIYSQKQLPHKEIQDQNASLSPQNDPIQDTSFDKIAKIIPSNNAF